MIKNIYRKKRIARFVANRKNRKAGLILQIFLNFSNTNFVRGTLLRNKILRKF